MKKHEVNTKIEDFFFSAMVAAKKELAEWQW